MFASLKQDMYFYVRMYVESFRNEADTAEVGDILGRGNDTCHEVS